MLSPRIWRVGRGFVNGSFTLEPGPLCLAYINNHLRTGNDPFLSFSHLLYTQSLKDKKRPIPEVQRQGLNVWNAAYNRHLEAGIISGSMN